MSSKRILGQWRGRLRYKTVREWALALEVGIPAIHHQLYSDKPFQDLIARNHDEVRWELWERFCRL